MNLETMRARCMTRYRDLANTLTVPTTWNEHINAAYLEFCTAADWGFEVTTKDVPVVAAAEYAALPAGVFGVLGVTDVAAGAALDPLEGWGRAAEWASNLDTGNPAFYRVSGPRLYLFPRPSSGRSLRVTYRLAPDLLESDDDEPILPERYQEAIVLGAVAAALLDDEETERAGVYQQRFESYVKRATLELASSGSKHQAYPRLPRGSSVGGHRFRR